MINTLQSSQVIRDTVTPQQAQTNTQSVSVHNTASPQNTIQSLKASASNPILWYSDSVTDNKKVEASIARFASESPAAHKTVDTLLANLVKLFVKVEGNELTATTRMLNAYTGNAPAFGVIGQLAAGGYTRIIDEAKYGGPRNEMVDKEPVSLREKSTAYFDITNSSYFSEVLEKIHQSPELKEQLKGIIDINYLESKEFAPARGSTKENPLPDKLALYTFKNENINNASKNPELYQVTKNIKGKEVSSNPALVGASLTAVQRDFREPSPHKDSTWSTAADLKADNRLMEREQNFAKLNPRNQENRRDYQFDQNGPIKANQSLPDDQIIVPRGNGFAVWQAKNDTGFTKDAALHHLPTVAAPSGTTDRFMTAARLLGTGAKNDLGLNITKSGENIQQTADRADLQLKELTRWLATAYLVDDNHHSMIEVNLGAANHGLNAQWGAELYTEPFSNPILANGFNISSHDVQAGIENQGYVTTHYETFKTDLYQGNKAKVTADGMIIKG